MKEIEEYDCYSDLTEAMWEDLWESGMESRGSESLDSLAEQLWDMWKDASRLTTVNARLNEALLTQGQKFLSDRDEFDKALLANPGCTGPQIREIIRLEHVAVFAAATAVREADRVAQKTRYARSSTRTSLRDTPRVNYGGTCSPSKMADR